MRRQTPESYVLSAVGELLTLRSVWWMRCQTGMHVLEHNGKKRVFRSGRPGMADILALPKSGAVWIECKAPGGVQSLAQKAFQAEVERFGMAYILVTDATGVDKWLFR